MSAISITAELARQLRTTDLRSVWLRNGAKFGRQLASTEYLLKKKRLTRSASGMAKLRARRAR